MNKYAVTFEYDDNSQIVVYVYAANRIMAYELVMEQVNEWAEKDRPTKIISVARVLEEEEA